MGLSLLNAFGINSAVMRTIRVAIIVSITRTPPNVWVIYFSISGSNILAIAIPYITIATLFPIRRPDISSSGFSIKRLITMAYLFPCFLSSSIFNLLLDRNAISYAEKIAEKKSASKVRIKSVIFYSFINNEFLTPCTGPMKFTVSTYGTLVESLPTMV